MTEGWDVTTHSGATGGSAHLVEQAIQSFYRAELASRPQEGSGPAATLPVGFSNGADPLWPRLKEDIGPPFLTPLEIFRAEFPEREIEAGELTVVCYVLPVPPSAVRDNREETLYPAESWARAKEAGNALVERLSEHLVMTLSGVGVESVAPEQASTYAIGRSDLHGIAASWSERHAAYVSGLGSFGLCDGFITEVGKAVRLGSLIARIPAEPSPRRHEDHHADCLFYARGTCGACARRCPVGAISPEGHDKMLCYKHCFGDALAHVKESYGLDEYACGLCQTGVPCASGRPIRSTVNSEPGGRSV
jgi:epoxyqueuosine reductase